MFDGCRLGRAYPIPYRPLRPWGRGSMDFPSIAQRWQQGDRAAGEALVAALEGELRRIAAAKLRAERHSSLSTGDLVNEALIKLSRLDHIVFSSKAHILALSSQLMRQVLVDAARHRNAQRRSGEMVTLTTRIADWDAPVDVLEIDLVLQELAAVDPDRAKIVEMRFFAGMGYGEIAEALNISEATAKRRWAATRVWLMKRLA